MEITGKSADDHYTTDFDGRRVLYGLTFEETSELEELRRRWWVRHTEPYATAADERAASARRRELGEKHERAWFEVIGATLAQREGPSIH